MVILFALGIKNDVILIIVDLIYTFNPTNTKKI